jgi:FtsP/CotA-like multicopper oxidase with cupredoxin domain
MATRTSRKNRIAPGHRFDYEFTTIQAGTYFYHTHAHVDGSKASVSTVH